MLTAESLIAADKFADACAEWRTAIRESTVRPSRYAEQQRKETEATMLRAKDRLLNSLDPGHETR